MPKLSFFSQTKQSSPSLREVVKQVKELEERLKEVTEELSAFKKASRKAVKKIGIVRFNPFGEIGGDQSFSLALLDEEDNGVVVTSHYGREMNRVYAKSIKKGGSEHTLSKEEREAIRTAVDNARD